MVEKPAASPDITRGLLFSGLSLTIVVFIRKSIITLSISRQRKSVRFRRIYVATGGYRHAADAISGLVPRRSQLDSRSGRPSLADPRIYKKLPTQNLFATQLETLLRQLFTDFSQAGNAKVLALQQIISRFANEFADGRQAKSCHALSCTN